MPNPFALSTEEYVRFWALLNWADTIGLCFQCRLACACAVVQREAGNKSWGKPPAEGCNHDQRVINKTYCQDLFVSKWKDAPKR